jgi:UDP-N-acetylmuramoylalanine--D-glutamate ligase
MSGARPTAPPGLTPDIPAISGKRVTVMGLGLFGGGAAAARFAAEQGARVTVTDLRTADVLETAIESLSDLDVTFVLGEHREEDFVEADLVIVSPGVPGDTPFVRKAADAGVALDTELNLFWKRCPAPIVAVTGSNGKSTTTSLVAELLRAMTNRTVHLGGNIGRPLINDSIQPDDLVVLETSSFQLEALDQIGARPDVAVVVNLSPNHLDRHGTEDAYVRAKASIIRHQAEADVAVLNSNLALHCRFQKGDARRIWFGTLLGDDFGVGVSGSELRLRLPWFPEQVWDLSDRALPGSFNLENIAAALAASLSLLAKVGEIDRVDLGRAEHVARTFSGIPHRLETVNAGGPIRFINDSVATSPESTLGALEALEGPLVLIAGGYDKKVDLGPMARAAATRCAAVVTIGVTGPAIAEAVQEAGGTAVAAESVEDAVRLAVEHLEEGIVLLSPACASYDQFVNFEARGQCFRDAALRRVEETV